MPDFYFYTETAFHHQGDPEYLRKLVLASRDAGAQGVKFQVLTRTGDFISTHHGAYKDLDSWTFSIEQWKDIFAFTRDCGLDIIMMPLNTGALHLLDLFPVRYLEIHSVSFNDTALQAKIRERGTDLIIGAGGRTEEEINAMLGFFGSQLKVLMTGFQSFPSKLEDIRLGRIALLKERYPALQIGYADHSAFDHEFAVIANDYAYLLGATVFEKHITVDEGVERVDYSAAVSPEKISNSIQRLQFIRDQVFVREVDCFAMNAAELKYRNRQLVCVAARALEAGTVLSEADLLLKMTDQPGDAFTRVADCTGRRLLNPLTADMPVSPTDIA